MHGAMGLVFIDFSATKHAWRLFFSRARGFVTSPSPWEAYHSTAVGTTAKREGGVVLRAYPTSLTHGTLTPATLDTRLGTTYIAGPPSHLHSSLDSLSSSIAYPHDHTSGPVLTLVNYFTNQGVPRIFVALKKPFGQKLQLILSCYHCCQLLVFDCQVVATNHCHFRSLSVCRYCFRDYLLLCLLFASPLLLTLFLVFGFFV